MALLGAVVLVVALVVALRWRAESPSRGRGEGAAPGPGAASARDQEGPSGTTAAPAASPAPVAVAPTPVATPPVPGAPAAPVVPGGGKAGEVDALNEAVLMARLRSAGGTDAALAIVLARSGNRRFPDSPDAPERSSILIHALASEGQASAARGEAEYMVNHYPDSSWVREVEGFTGAHRHRNAVVTDAGTIEYR